MKNLNDVVYDYKNYSVYGIRDHDEFVVDDKSIEHLLFSYLSFEEELITDIIGHKRKVYLRFCDGEFMYYKKNTLKDYLIKLYRFIRQRNKTCRGEKADSTLLAQHFDFFQKNKNIVRFFPHVSKTYANLFKKTKFWDYLFRNRIHFGHFYYIYHFLNKVRQGKIDVLKHIKIAYVTHHAYIDSLDHYPISNSYSKKDAEKLSLIDFSQYDLILLGGGIASPLWADAIKKCSCPIIDSGYMLSIWDKKGDNADDRVFTGLL